MEKSFEEFIDTLKLPKKMYVMLKSSIEKWGDINTENKENNIVNIQAQLFSIQTKMKQIEDKVLSITNE